jgi:hypothetical protein
MVGVTVCVPPAAWRVYALPSLPLTVTWVALVAATVKVDELPALIEVGLAVMLTVGAVAELPDPLASLFLKLAPHPVSSESAVMNAAGSSIRKRDRRMTTFVTVFSLLLIFVRYRKWGHRF